MPALHCAVPACWGAPGVCAQPWVFAVLCPCRMWSGWRGGALGWEMVAQTPGMLCSACVETLLASGVQVASICCICDGIRHPVPQCQQPHISLCWGCSMAMAWAALGSTGAACPAPGTVMMGCWGLHGSGVTVPAQLRPAVLGLEKKCLQGQ